MEGGGRTATILETGARRREVPTRTIHAETWKERLLHARQRSSGAQAKTGAGELPEESSVGRKSHDMHRQDMTPQGQFS